MSAIHFEYTRSKALCARLFVEQGEVAAGKAAVAVEATAIAPEVRAQLVALLGAPQRLGSDRSGYYVKAHLATEMHRDGSVDGYRDDLVLDYDITADTLAAVLLAVAQAQERYERLVAEAEPVHAAYLAAKAERERAAQSERQERWRANEIHEAAEQSARAAAEADRRVWIEALGSAFLRKAVGAGYDCQRRYVRERAAAEHPDATVDIENAADWKSRACPSEAALDFALAHGGEVVWLTEPARDRKAPQTDEDYDSEEFEACEAVVVRKWLGQYDVVYTSF